MLILKGSALLLLSWEKKNILNIRSQMDKCTLSLEKLNKTDINLNSFIWLSLVPSNCWDLRQFLVENAAILNNFSIESQKKQYSCSMEKNNQHWTISQLDFNILPATYEIYICFLLRMPKEDINLNSWRRQMENKLKHCIGFEKDIPLRIVCHVFIVSKNILVR